MTIEDSLGALGLSKKQSAVYIALLQVGTNSAYAVARKSGLKNPTTYVILNELVAKGLVQKLPRAKKQLLVAQPPEEIFTVAEERLALAKRSLPKLKAMNRTTSAKVSTAYFDGVAGIKQVMDYRMKEMAGKQYAGFYATSENIPKELTAYIHEWGKRLKRQNSSLLGIVPRHASLKEFRNSDTDAARTMKVVPHEEFSSEVELDTVDDLVRIIDYKNLQGVVLENADVAKTVREIFEMLWKRL